MVYQHLVGSSYCWLEFNQACDEAQYSTVYVCTYIVSEDFAWKKIVACS